MKNRFFNGKVVFGLLTLVMCFGGSIGMSYGQAIVSVEPAEVESPAAGEELTVSINIEDGAGVAGYQIIINFDPTALRYISGGNADYLPAGAFTVPVVATDNSITIAATSLTGAALDADGTLATVTFEVVEAKASIISLGGVTLADDAPNVLEVSTMDGMVLVAANYILEIRIDDYRKVYAVGETVAPSFFVFAGLGRAPVANEKLTITSNGLTDVTISNGGTTDALGRVQVTGVVTGEPDVYITAEWPGGAKEGKINFEVDRPAIHQEHPSLVVDVAGDGPMYIGKEVEVTFFVTPARQVPLYIEASAMEITSIVGAGTYYPPFRGSYTTSFMGTLTVHATITGQSAYISAIWEEMNLSAQAYCPCLPTAQIEAQPPQEPTVLMIVSGDLQGEASNTTLGNPFVVEVWDQYDRALSGVDVVFRVVKGDGRLSTTTARTNSAGQAETILTFGADPGIYQVEASVDGYPSLRQTFTAVAATIAECEIPEPEPPKPTSLSIVSGYGQEGEPDTRLRNPFVVEVRDQNGNPFSGALVVFSVTGGGKVSPITARTNNNGRAQTTLTLGSSAGVNVVKASVSGVSLPQVFTSSAIAPPEPEPEPEPVVSEQPSTPQLPPMYWIENNVIYYLPTGGSKQMLYMLRDGILTGGLTVDTESGRIYWTEETASGMGRVLSADLTGRDVQTVREIRAVPYGIAVGSDKGNNRWIYWVTSTGKIQRIKVNGSGFDGVLVSSVDSPGDIAFDEVHHHLYWTDGARICSVAANGRGKKKIVIGNLEGLWGIAVANGTVYWTERMGTDQGKVRSINGNGSTPKLLAVLESVPVGIAVDAAGGRVYWTTSLGGIESASFTGSIETVVVGAGISTTGIALGRSSSVPSSPAGPAISSLGSQENVLLANYPNPFNPETWIPYQLSESSDVNLSIYSVDGKLVRTLDLGYQSAGVYRSKSRAAYWDGRNEFGERMASGLYFYTLTVGDFTATRKMLIRK